jgi:sarcosine oxidase
MTPGDRPPRARAAFDVGVVGLGGLGAATAYWLAQSSKSVVGFEQFELGHVRGASHDHSRIIRRSYHTPAYVQLTASAYEAWERVERETGSTLVTVTGGLDLFPPGAAIDPRAYRTSLEESAVAHDWIDGGEVRRRWPAFSRGTLVTDDVQAIFSPAAGIVPAGRATALFHRAAARHGADLRANTGVRELRPVGNEVDVVTDQGTVRCRSVVVCADAWTNRLLEPLGHRLELSVTREQVTYFATPDLADLQPGQLPVWIWMDDPSFYGFPEYGVTDAFKAAEDCGGPPVDPDTRSFDPDPLMEACLRDFVTDLIGERRSTMSTTTCLYTLTSDRDFVLDRLPDIPQISVGLGAAHGFKFAAWFGRQLAALSTGADPGPELAPFSMTRDALQRPADRAAWLV